MKQGMVDLPPSDRPEMCNNAFLFHFYNQQVICG